MGPPGHAVEHFAAQLPRLKALCIGDVMLDRFVDGSVERISPESPVPVLLTGKTVTSAGGASNVARNITSLGATCTVIGLVGDDAAGRELRQMLDHTTGVTCALVVCAEACTPEKIRFVSQGQHLLRVDRETTVAPDERVDDALKNEISRHIDACNVIILSDYAKGTLSPAVIRYAIDQGRLRGLPIVVDPKCPDFSRYARATVITPNVKEIKNATGIQVLTDEDAIAAGEAGCRAANADALLITRAEKGMTLVPMKGTPFHCRTSAREVYDVVGAGDTVVAVLGLALAAKTSMTLATTLANVAGGLVVGRRGASTIGRPELLQHALALSKSESEQQRCKVMLRKDLVKLCKTWRDAGLKVGFTNGCFDILHPGHINLVTFAKSHCDRLVLAVNSDASVRRLKGSGRPVNHVDDRVAVLEALQAIDALTVFEEDTPLNLIQELMPDVLVKGSDYTESEVVGADLVRGHGGDMLLCPLVPGKSTTTLIKRIA
jgi:D-beta-D-heptose 7-phosphate kinase/D-beta-D-heptose 1-phosphate adenosyltransferase